jgi:hypothetical protein
VFLCLVGPALFDIKYLFTVMEKLFFFLLLSVASILLCAMWYVHSSTFHITP